MCKSPMRFCLLFHLEYNWCIVERIVHMHKSHPGIFFKYYRHHLIQQSEFHEPPTVKFSVLISNINIGILTPVKPSYNKELPTFIIINSFLSMKS